MNGILPHPLYEMTTHIRFSILVTLSIPNMATEVRKQLRQISALAVQQCNKTFIYRHYKPRKYMKQKRIYYTKCTVK